MKKIAIIALVVALVGLAIYWFALRSPVADADLIQVSGNIEVTDAEVSFKMAGRVDSRSVDEGQFVQKEATVAVLDAAELESELALRSAEMHAAEAALAELIAGTRSEEIAAAKAAMEGAQAFVNELVSGARPQEIKAAKAKLEANNLEVVHVKSDFDRAQALIRSDAVSQQEYDASMAIYEIAITQQVASQEGLKLIEEGPRAEQIERARATLSQTKAQYDLAKAGPREETIQQARARIEQVKASVGLAEIRIAYATLKSPLTGIVLSKNVEPGEYVAAGTPVVTVGDLENVWLRAYINETDLGRVKVGQLARVKTDTYPDRQYEGRVSFISSEAEFTPKNVQTSQERVKLVYRIKVDIANIRMELKPGMPADATIELQAK